MLKKFLFLFCLVLLSGCQIALPGIGDQKVTVKGMVKTGEEIGVAHCAQGLYIFNPFPFEKNLYLQLRWDKETFFDETKFIGQEVTIEGTLPDQSDGICEALTCECARYLVVSEVKN